MYYCKVCSVWFVSKESIQMHVYQSTHIKYRRRHGIGKEFNSRENLSVPFWWNPEYINILNEFGDEEEFSWWDDWVSEYNGDLGKDMESCAICLDYLNDKKKKI